MEFSVTQIKELKKKMLENGVKFGDIFPLLLTDNGGEFSDIFAFINDEK